MTEPTRPTRTHFSDQLEEIRRLVARQFALVLEGVAGATTVLLGDDVAAAERIVARDEVIDELERRIETQVDQQLLLEAPVARDFRFLMAMSRVVPELERSGDLAEHVAAEAARGFGRNLTPGLRGLVQDMGDVVVQMWQRASDALEHPTDTIADELDAVDDRVDELHRRFVDDAAEELTGAALMSAGLVGRYYERLGDHAVNVSRRLGTLAG